MSDFTFRSVPEETLYIDLPDTDGLKIKGILRGDVTMPVVVMVHGLPGTGNALLQYLGARYLYEHGFATFRIFLYDETPHTRDLIDCTLKEHAEDFDTVVRYLRKRGAQKLFGVGHSYGGLTILRSSAPLEGAVLWDPTHGEVFHGQAAAEWQKKARFQKVPGLRLYLSGKGYIESDATYEEQQNMGDTSELATMKKFPLEVISAGKGIMVDLGQKYAAKAEAQREHVIIQEADHVFTTSDKVMLQLFEETTKWFKECTDA